MKDKQKKINDVYQDVFGYTPQTERLEDLQKQFFKLMRNTGVKELKECTGDLLTTLIQLANESEWDVNELIDSNLEKLIRRKDQYRSLGRKKRIAIYGGAFNPITNGHIQSAQFVLNTSGYFDEVWLMPAYKHMYNKHMESSEKRLAMCELAAKVDARIKVFDYEIRYELAGETFKLVKQLKNDPEYENFDFSFIMGLDNANTFHKWVNYEHLEKMMKFVVIPRKGYEIDEKVDWYLQKPHIYLNKEENNIIEVSSTLVRNLLKDLSSKFPGLVKEELKKYVDENVIDFISKNNLYQSDNRI
jgi:nicotinate-nucleotide adenylyltransferase